MGLCRLFCGFEDIYCLFLGSLNNIWSLNKQYGLTKGTNEAMFVIEAFRTLRDRGPYPADQVVKDFDGSFAFVVYDSKGGTVFAALLYTIYIYIYIYTYICVCHLLLPIDLHKNVHYCYCRVLMVE
jgi:hypothetical protein